MDVKTEGGQSVGQLRAVAGSVGLAHLKLSTALAAMDGKAVLMAGSGVRVVPSRPSWWPQEWGYEEQGAEEKQ